MKLLSALAAVAAILPALAAAVPYNEGVGAAAPVYVAGKDYEVLSTPLPTSTGSKIEVREFFAYSCSHCYSLEPAIKDWAKTKPADVELVLVPVMFNTRTEPHGRAFYVAEALGVQAKVHPAIFDAIHIRRQQLLDKESIAAVFTAAGVQRAAFDGAWDSFAVKTKVREAQQQSVKYMIRGTPTLAVNGKYLVSAGERSMAIVDFLIQKERAARK